MDDPETISIVLNALQKASKLLSHKETDIPVCHTRIKRTGRGLPWNEQIAIHPKADGGIEMKALQPDPPPCSA